MFTTNNSINGGNQPSSSSSSSFTTIRERVVFEKEIKRSKFIAIASPIFDEQSTHSFLSEVRDTRASNNCWAYKIDVDFNFDAFLPRNNSSSRIRWSKVLVKNVGDQYRSNDDGEPSGTAGRPILSAIDSSGIDRVMIVVIRHFGGIKLGTGGLVRAYGGVTSECLRNASTCVVKSKISMGVEVTFDLLGVLYHQLQSFQVEDIKEDYETGKDGTTMVTFKVEFDQVESLEDAVKSNCSHELVFYKR